MLLVDGGVDGGWRMVDGGRTKAKESKHLIC